MSAAKKLSTEKLILRLFLTPLFGDFPGIGGNVKLSSEKDIHEAPEGQVFN